MWCPRCQGEFRDGIERCPACDVFLVGSLPEMPDEPPRHSPLTGRPLIPGADARVPAVAGTFVTMDEAQSALRALSDAGIGGEVVTRDEQLPMTVSKDEPTLAVAVPAPDLSRARRILRNRGLIPVAIARYRRDEDAHRARAILEARGLRPRISTIVMDDVPADFRADMEPYVLEVPADEEMAANDALRGTILKICENCGAQLHFGENTCKACGLRVIA